MTAPAQRGKHWLTEVIPVVRDDVGSFSGVLSVESLLEQTAPLKLADHPTVEFDRAAFEFGLQLDRQIAAARLAEQKRLVGRVVRLPFRERSRRFVRDNWNPFRAAYVMATVGVFVGGAVGWWLR